MESQLLAPLPQSTHRMPLNQKEDGVNPPLPYQRVFVTGGAGFIGSHVVRALIAHNIQVLCYDKLTYAGNRSNLDDVQNSSRLQWCIADLRDCLTLRESLEKFQPQAIIHLAAESHVDRSIASPFEFIASNVMSCTSLATETLRYRDSLPTDDRDAFRILQISTDEVFGSIDHEDAPKFNEQSPYSPNSPYSASKGAGDLILKSFRHTFGLPAAILYSSNNYGPNQHPEKLLPKTILNALNHRIIPLYGDGTNVRDWLHVQDHVGAILKLLAAPKPLFMDYAIGGVPLQNIELLNLVLDEIDRIRPESPEENGGSIKELIRFVPDRPGHDFRYEVDSSSIKNNLGWTAKISLKTGLNQTIRWYMNNPGWFASAAQ